MNVSLIRKFDRAPEILNNYYFLNRERYKFYPAKVDYLTVIWKADQVSGNVTLCTTELKTGLVFCKPDSSMYSKHNK